MATQQLRDVVGVDDVPQKTSLMAAMNRLALAPKNVSNNVQKAANVFKPFPSLKPVPAPSIPSIIPRPIARPVKKAAPLPGNDPPRKTLPPLVDPHRVVTCSDVSADVFQYLLQREKLTNVPEAYLGDEKGVNSKNRVVLIDWLVQVHDRFHLLAETLHLCIHLVDAYLSKNQVAKAELQLVGIVSLLVAAKYEEQFAPVIEDIVFITDGTYTKEQIKEMEVKILRSVSWDLSRPASITMLRLLERQLGVSVEIHTLARYFGEVAILEYTMAHMSPSHIAAASLVLASHLTDGSVCAESACSALGITTDELNHVGKRLALSVLKLHQSVRLIAVRVKYSSAKLHSVSSFTAVQTAKLRLLVGF